MAPLLTVPQPVEAAQATILAQEEGPAELVPEVEEEEVDLPWTNRYLAPTAIVLGGLVVALAVVGYGVRVRGRYCVTK